MNNEYLKLCLVTNISSCNFDHYEKFISSAALGGVTSVQLREKNMDYSELKYFALMIQATLKPFNIPFIINDHVELAKEINADGVHLGQSDMPPLEARHILGENKIIGLSIESLAQLKIANHIDCINYIGASAIFSSHTKSDCKKIWGITGLKKLSTLTRHPIIGIGGITVNNVCEVIKNGADGVAIISAIHDHSNPQEISDIFIKKINKYLNMRTNHV
jgi:thiamine-phosphate pyrophosphorylase